MITYFVDVILPLAVPQTYTYRVPVELNEEVMVGQRVIVQFGRGKLYSGIIESVHQNSPKQYEAKYLDGIIDDYPVVTQNQIAFWKWIAEYYMCTLGEVMAAALPSNLKLASESNVLIHDEFDGDIDILNDKELRVLEVLEVREQLSLKEIADVLEQKTVHHVVKSMIEKNVIILEEELKNKYKPKTKTYLKLSENLKENESQLKDTLDKLSRAPKQLQALMKYLEIIGFWNEGVKYEIEKKDLELKADVSGAVIKQLIDKSIFEKLEIRVDRLEHYDEEVFAAKKLSGDQQTAFNEVKEVYKEKDIVLLHGVTGSGKTEVYIHLIDEVIKKGKQVLYLLPEIALTTQLIKRLQYHFGDAVGVYHSKFSANERVEVWHKVLNHKPGDPSVIIGARSSIFLPFEDLGLIILDEEHETSFKQHNPAPRYNARDAAIVLAKSFNAKVVLGSATPSIESYWAAKQGKYGLVEMNNRYGGLQLPEVLVADLQAETRQRKMHDHFSSFLVEHVNACLKNKEQIILFQNRRGYTPLWECEMCGWTPKCNNCDVSLTYHKYHHLLKCHYCASTHQPPTKCGACGSHKIKMLGFGTEKIEDDLKHHFPNIRVSRMDLDSTRSKNAYHQIISDFEDHNIDILVGTQMVTKGLDFDNVGLVAVLNADQMLKFPDFRAYERAYQLMSQVAGRAGRKKKRGKVVIQSFLPNHWIIQQVIAHDYIKMYDNEILERKNYHYPPFYRVINIHLKHRDKDVVRKAALELSAQLRVKLGGRVLGPETPHISRIRNMYLQNIVLKFERNTRVNDLKEWLKDVVTVLGRERAYKTVRFVFDVDPV